MAKELKKLVPNIRFKGFTDDWEQRKLGEIVTFFSGLTYHPTDVRDTGCLVVRSSNIKNQQVVSADDVFVSNNIVNVPNVKLGDIIVVVRNGSRKLIGKHAQVLTNMPNTVIGAFMTGIRSSNNSYIEALLDSSQFKKEIHKNLGATINQITNGEFKRMKFFVTAGVEAQQLGILFKQINNLLALQQRKLELLKQVKKGLLQKMFADKDSNPPILHFNGFTGDWKQQKLEDVVIDYKKKNNNNQLPVLTSSVQGIEYQEKHFGSRQRHDISDYNLLPQGYITYRNRSDSGYFKFNINNLGVTGIVSKFYPVFSTRSANKIFLTSYINNNAHIRNYFKIVSVGTSQHVLSLRSFKKTSILFPSEKEQDKIGSLFSQIGTFITFQQSRIDKLTLLKKFFLQQMFI